MLYVFVNVITICLFVVFIFVTRTKNINRTDRWFITFITTILLWGIARFVTPFLGLSLATFLFNLAICIVTFSPYFLYLFVIDFTGYQGRLGRIFKYILLSQSLLVLFFALIGELFQQITIISKDNISIDRFGLGYVFVIIALSSGITASLIILIIASRKSSTSFEKKKVNHIILAIICGYISAVCLAAIPDLFVENYQVIFTRYEFPLLAIPILVLNVAVYRAQFMNIKRHILRVRTFYLLTVLFTSVIFTIISLGLYFLNSVEEVGTLLNILISLLLTFFFMQLTLSIIQKRNKYSVSTSHEVKMKDILFSDDRFEVSVNKLANYIVNELKISYVKIETPTFNVSNGVNIKSGLNYLKKDDQKIDIHLRTHDNSTWVKILIGSRNNLIPFFKKERQIFQRVTENIFIKIKDIQDQADYSSLLKKEIVNATFKLKKANKKLIEIDQTKNEFISMASHQLRTPLSVINNYQSLLMSGYFGILNKKQKNAVSSVGNSVEQMVYMIDELLDAARITNGTFTVDMQPVNLSEVLDREITKFSEIAKDKKISINLTNKFKTKTIICDGTKLGEVVSNFIDNAIQYSKQNSSIAIKLEESSKNIVLSVSDKGIGVPKKEQKLLFSKFKRGSNAQKIRPDGTGLGLFVAKKIIEAHKGKVIFKSKLGQGSTFGFELPKQ